MAVLLDEARFELWAEYMRDNSEAITITKVQLRAAVDAADAWASSNAASYNTALPVAARNALSAQQKAKLLSYVIAKRHKLEA